MRQTLHNFFGLLLWLLVSTGLHGNSLSTEV